MMEPPILTSLRSALSVSPVSGGTAGASVLVPLVMQSGTLSLLLEIRAEGVRQPGEICFPGGSVDPGETAEAAALRELEEELGIAGSSVCPLGFLPCDNIPGRRGVDSLVGLLPPDSLEQLRPSAAEVAGTFLLPLDWLQKTKPQTWRWDPAAPDERIPAALLRYLKRYELPLSTQYWEYEGHGIWGLTARILCRLVAAF